jgi:hypothetical protein
MVRKAKKAIEEDSGKVEDFLPPHRIIGATSIARAGGSPVGEYDRFVATPVFPPGDDRNDPDDFPDRY